MLDQSLNLLGTEVELDLAPWHSCENPSQILQYDQNSILITGITPNPIPAVSWGEMQSFTALINLEDVLSVENQITNSKDVVIYPNLASDEATLVIPDNDAYRFSVYNTLGQMVYNQNKIVQGNINLNVSNYQSGVYFIKFHNGKKSFTKQLIVK